MAVCRFPRDTFHLKHFILENISDMSTGLFMGVRNSFTDDAQTHAAQFLNSINRALKTCGCAEYLDPVVPPDVYNGHMFGRSALDHHSSRILSATVALVGDLEHFPQLALIHNNPYRLSFVPANFDLPLQTDYADMIFETPTFIHIGSLPRLRRELEILAEQLRIQMDGSNLDDNVASKINDWIKLQPEDSVELVEDQRTAWLLLYEGARLALTNDVALSLAG